MGAEPLECSPVEGKSSPNYCRASQYKYIIIHFTQVSCIRTKSFKSRSKRKVNDTGTVTIRRRGESREAKQLNVGIKRRLDEAYPDTNKTPTHRLS